MLHTCAQQPLAPTFFFLEFFQKRLGGIKTCCNALLKLEYMYICSLYVPPPNILKPSTCTCTCTCRMCSQFQLIPVCLFVCLSLAQSVSCLVTLVVNLACEMQVTWQGFMCIESLSVCALQSTRQVLMLL